MRERSESVRNAHAAWTDGVQWYDMTWGTGETRSSGAGIVEGWLCRSAIAGRGDCRTEPYSGAWPAASVSITDQRAGPYIVSIWAHAIVGKGGNCLSAFESAAAGRWPDDLEGRVDRGSSRSERLPERHYAAPTGNQSLASLNSRRRRDLMCKRGWRRRAFCTAYVGTGEALAIR